MQQKVYMAVSLDKLQLPMFVAETLDEIAAWSGRSKSDIKVAINYNYKDKKNKCSYIITKI